jgi:Activator of Hsp90 ATPase homolog 1-like protein
MEFDWTSFTKRIAINASADAIYRSWATKQGMESWFLRQCNYTSAGGEALPEDSPVQKGNRYTWYWHGWPDETNERGAILDTNGLDTLTFTFGQEMICTVLVFAEAGETICELVQKNIPVDDMSKSNYFVGCNTGWTFYMTNLKSILEGGIDLRNKNVAVKNVLNS